MMKLTVKVLGGASAEVLGCAFERRMLYRKSILQTKVRIYTMSSTKIDIRSIVSPNNSYLWGLTLTHGAFSHGGTVLVACGTGIVKSDSAKPVICCVRDK
jgi:hypothetical protein